MTASFSILQLLYTFFLGLCVGSFLNLVVDHLPKELPILRGRAGCQACGSRFGLVASVPILGHCLQRGRCGICGTKLPLRGPITEIVTALLFCALLLRYGFGWQLLVMASIISLLICIAAIDLIYMEIYTVMVILLAALCLAGAQLVFDTPLRDRIIGGIAGFVAFYLIYIVAKLVYGREAFGLGDVYLMGALGLLLGGRNTFIAGMFSFYIAAAALLVLKLLGRHFPLRQEIPFGPYVCAGALVAIFWGDGLTNLYFSFVASLA